MVRVKKIPIKEKVDKSRLGNPSKDSQLRNVGRRMRPGEKMIRDPRRYNIKSDVVFLGRPSFARLVKEITQENFPGFRYQTTAVEAIRTVAEAHLLQIFEDAKLCANHAAREVVTLKDFKLAIRLAHV